VQPSSCMILAARQLASLSVLGFWSTEFSGVRAQAKLPGETQPNSS